MAPAPEKSAKYVFVVVHGDMWGAYNANWIVKAVRERGAEPILFVSRSSTNEAKEILVGAKDQRPLFNLKERELEKYFDLIDHMPPSVAKDAPEYQTFNALANNYCPDKLAHLIATGGFEGGRQMEQEFARLEKQGITPECVLSGDTMAFLPPSITDRYDCFSTHPGALDDSVRNAGANCTERAVLDDALYNYMNGELLPPGTQLGENNSSLKGSLFKQVSMEKPTDIDKGPVIETVLSPVTSGQCLLEMRTELYYGLVDAMIKHMDEFLDKNKRAALVQKAYAEQERKNIEAERSVDKLKGDRFKRWQGKGARIDSFVGFEESPLWTPEGPKPVVIAQLEHEQNHVVSPHYLRNRMSEFYPGGMNEAFMRDFKAIFSDELRVACRQRNQRGKEETARMRDEDVRLCEQETGARLQHALRHGTDKEWLDRMIQARGDDYAIKI